jgi:Ca2+-binding RTX toxin-like protein
MFELLESRRMLSFTANVNGGSTLSIKGGTSDNNLLIVENNGHVHVTDHTTGAEADFNGITALNVMGNTGNDTINFVGNSVGINLNGDSGDDQLVVGDEGTGSSMVDGGAGNDLVYSTVSHHTTLTGGSGDDFIAINGAVDVDPNAFDYINAETIVVAGSGNDIIQVWAGKNTINAGAGNDELIIIREGLSTNTVSKVEMTTVSNPPLPA